MTEREWLTGTAPQALLDSKRVVAWSTDRQQRLSGAACCRQIWHLIPDPRSKAAVEVAERFADCEATAEELAAAREVAGVACGQWRRFFGRNEHGDRIPPRYSGTCAAYVSTCADANYALHAWTDMAETALDAGAKWHAELAAACDLVRDLHGNPFTPVSFDPAWLTSDALGLAGAIYAGRAWERMPILADALEEAGCDDAAMLGHCRGHAGHARGCWVVDGVLGKR